MRPRPVIDSGQSELFRARLDQILNLDHELVRLARLIDWDRLDAHCAGRYRDSGKGGHPPLPTRLMAGLAILKHTFDLSDEELCARWLENPYFQFFCGEEFFRHELPFDRSSMTRWRQRLGEAELNALLQESLAAALKAKALKPADLDKVIVDTTVQEKAVAFPTDARLMSRARERLVRLAKRHGVALRQSYVRVGKLALIKHQRYRHAKHFNRAKACLRTIKTQLGRVVRDLERKIARRPELNAVFRRELYKATRVATQKPRDGRRHIYALHAPEVECIGKGKAHKPYEFGVKVSVATTLERSRGGQFVVHVKALPGNPYDGHTLAEVIPEIEAISGATLKRIVADAGYRGHNAPMPYKLRVFTAGQKRRMTPEIKRRMKRRSAVEPVIGHLKAEHRMGRNHLAHAAGDAANALFAAIGYNFRRLLTWLKFLHALFAAIRCTFWMYPIAGAAKG